MVFERLDELEKVLFQARTKKGGISAVLGPYEQATFNIDRSELNHPEMRCCGMRKYFGDESAVYCPSCNKGVAYEEAAGKTIVTVLQLPVMQPA